MHNTILPFENRATKKNGHEGHRTGSHLRNRNGKNTRTGLQIDSSSTLFSRLGSVRLLSVSQLKARLITDGVPPGESRGRER